MQRMRVKSTRIMSDDIFGQSDQTYKQEHRTVEGKSSAVVCD